MSARTSLSEIDAQIEKLREKRRSLLVKANERFARAASKAGLAELDIPDNEIDAIFAEVAARFQKDQKKGAGRSTASTDGPADRRTGTATAISHDG